MSNNLHRVQNIFISDGAALPANDAAITAVTAGQIGIYGRDMKALNPAGGDTITTQPVIYIVEGKTDSNGVAYVKRSMKIDGASVLNFEGKPYQATKRESWAIGYNRLLAAGSIEVNNDTNYHFSILFKDDKHLYSERPELLNVNFTSALAATQLTIATQIAASINNSSFTRLVIAVVVGDGTGAYGLTGATNYGVEITAKDVNQFLSTTYTLDQVYFSVATDNTSGFEATVTAQIQAFDPGNGTYSQVYAMENFDFQYEGVLNRREWFIPVLDYAASAAYISSTAIAETVATTIGSDLVTFSATVAAKLVAGDKVTLDGVAYEIKYFISATVAILTSVAITTNAAGAVLLRVKYDLVTIEFNDMINTPTGVVAVANKSVVIAVPALDAGDAYNGVSAAGQDVMDILNAWMITTPRALANIAI